MASDGKCYLQCHLGKIPNGGKFDSNGNIFYLNEGNNNVDCINFSTSLVKCNPGQYLCNDNTCKDDNCGNGCIIF